MKMNWFNPGMDAAMRFRNGFMEVSITSRQAVLSRESHIDTIVSAMLQCRWLMD